MTATANLVEFKLADVGEGMHEAEILRWLVEQGDSVKADQIILEIQTDKAVVELPAPVSGKITEIVTKVGVIARVGDTLVKIEPRSEGRGQRLEIREEAKDELRVTSPTGKAETLTVTPQILTIENSNPSPITHHPSPTGRVRAAPAVRKKAVELGIDLTQVQPSSADGRILLEDVLNWQRKEERGERREEGGQETEVRDQRSEVGEEVSPVEEEIAQVKAEENPAESGQIKEEHSSTLNVLSEIVPIELMPIENAATSTTPDPTEETIFKSPSDNHPPKATSPTPRPQPLTPNLTSNIQLRGLRRRIAERMAESWRTIPQVSTFSEVDGEELFNLRQNLKPLAEKRGLNLTYLPFVIKAVTLTLKHFPNFNASFDETNKEIIVKHFYHIGIATATPDGLLVPVIKFADQKSLAELATDSARLAEGARSRKLTQSELSGSTFTITNVGSFGGDVGTAIINPPEVAILGTGKLQEKAIARNGQVVVRKVLPLSLTFDHRLIDGADAGAFINFLKDLLENPAQMLLDLV
jgi:pyruvate dehydrogenase E2 component (dihydrolipoamide acetyltransferase)